MRLNNFDIAWDRAYFRPNGIVSLDLAVNAVDEAIAFARRQGVPQLLADVRGLFGFGPPTLADRYWFSSKWAFTASGAVSLAVVARPEIIDPLRFGVGVARNQGLTADVFESESEAMVWLDSGV